MPTVTEILQAHSSGDASRKAFDLLYLRLRRLAARHLRNEFGSQTLQTTALLNEAFVRLVGPSESNSTWQNRRHFLAAASEAMRRILIDAARAKSRVKRGGDQVRIDLDQLGENGSVEALSTDLLALDVALDRLDQQSPIRADVVKLRFFAGMTMKDVSETLEIGLSTAERHWTLARAWLRRELAS